MLHAPRCSGARRGAGTMQKGQDKLRGGFNRTDLTLFWIGFLLLMFSILCSCSWFRHDTEDFYYDYAFKVMRDGVSHEIRDRCGFDKDIPHPEFSWITQKDLDLFAKSIHYRYKIKGYYSRRDNIIVYSKWKPEVISHETVHHMVHVSQFSRDCLEEMLAEMVQYAVELDQDSRNLENRLQRGK